MIYPQWLHIFSYIWLGKYSILGAYENMNMNPKFQLEKDLEFGKKTRHGFSLLDADEERFLPNWAMKSMCFWYDKVP